MDFVNLHGHSHYSLLQAFGSPEKIVKRAKELGQTSVALTDNGVIYGLVEFYKAAKKQGIKPILGCDLYIAARKMTDKQANDSRSSTLTVLAENNQGYENLVKLVTEAHLTGFYYKPRVDYELLKKHSKGLIALSGGLTAKLPRLILAGSDQDIDEHIKLSLDTFGKNNYFLEIQDNPQSPNQEIVNQKIKQLAAKHDLPMVITCNSFYLTPEDQEIHDIMICIQTQTNVENPNRVKFEGDFSLRDLTTLKENYKDYKDVFSNTVKISERCNVDFEFGKNLIPTYDTPKDHNPETYLRLLCEQGLAKKFPKQIPPGYKERLDFELKTVHSMGFDTYFLIVQDFIKYAKNQEIIVGPGRGSAAGSIIAWTLGITELDPIKYGLFFERFLNPERVSMPDIDIDFADTRREEVLKYVVEKYGQDNVAQVVTFGTMAPKAAIRDTGRALGYPYAEVDNIAKTVPPAILGKYAPLYESIKEDPELSALYQKDLRAKRLLDIAKKLEGTVRHIGTHACAVMISEKPLTTYTALQYGAGGNEIVTQYSAKPLEDLGLLKMDFLGLRNLTVIEHATEILKRTKKTEIDLENLDLEDKKTFELLQKGETTGVFQLESGGMKRYLKELKPTKFEDIVAMGALYRPGPMKYIPDYINGKHHPDQVKYFHDSFKEILEPTYGVAVFQEQILQLARDFAGFSLGEADILRKAVGKKDPKLLEEQREKFVKGAVANNHSKKFAEDVFENVIEPFAGYGFNKAHAACYGMIAYQTAYLKANFPTEFMTALLCSDANNTDRVVLEIKECQEMGIDVLPPSVNESFSNFTVTGKKQIRFGLLAIKGVGEGPLKVIISERKQNGKFKNIEDFAARLPAQILNKKLLESLAYSGALDELGQRAQIAEHYDQITKYAKQIQLNKEKGQTDIFGMLTEDESSKLNLPQTAPLSSIDKLKLEKKHMGMYVSSHPLKGLTPYIKKRARLIASLSNKNIDKKVNLVGLITDYRKIMTRSGNYMATFQLEDTSARVSVVVFPKSYQEFQDHLEEDNIILLSGKADNKRGNYQIIADNVELLSIEKMITQAKEKKLFDSQDKALPILRQIDDIITEKQNNLDNKDTIFALEIPAKTTTNTLENIHSLLKKNPGNMEIHLHLKSINKNIKLPFTAKITPELAKTLKNMLK